MDGNLYVGNRATIPGSVDRYNATTGEFIDVFTKGAPPPFEPSGVAFGPDGNLYVSDFSVNSAVLLFNGTTGEFIRIFANVRTPGGGIASPLGLVFGHDNNLYVSAAFASNVQRFDMAGNPIGPDGIFVPATGGLNFPVGLAFGRDGNLYVAFRDSDNVGRFNGVTGEFMGIFPVGSGLDAPQGLAFDSDGNLYVSSSFTDNVLSVPTSQVKTLV